MNTAKSFAEFHQMQEVIYEGIDGWFIIGHNTLHNCLVLGRFDDNAYGWSPVKSMFKSDVILFPDMVFIKKCWRVPSDDIKLKE